MMDTTFKSKVDDIGKLLKYFHPERIAYLITTVASFIILITCAFVLIIKQSEDYASIFGLFGSSGVISYTASRLLRMWTDAVKMLSEDKKNGKSNN